jgi:hypothetical protein
LDIFITITLFFLKNSTFGSRKWANMPTCDTIVTKTTFFSTIHIRQMAVAATRNFKKNNNRLWSLVVTLWRAAARLKPLRRRATGK